MPYLGSEQTKQLLENTVLQNGDPRDNTHLQRRILPHTNKQPVQEVHAFSYLRQNLSIQSTTLCPVHSPHGVHCDSQRGPMASNEKGYKDPPVPRRLVCLSHVPPGLSPTNTNPSNPLTRIGLASERGKIRAGTQTSFQFCRLPVRLERGQGQTHHRTLADPTNQDTGDHSQSSVSSAEYNVPDRTTDCHRETSTLGQVTYETHTVASQKQLESARNTGEDHPHSKVTPLTSRMVAGGKQCYHRSTLTPSGTCAADLYRRIKRRVGHSLKQAHGKGKLVTPRKQTAHKLPRVKGSSSGVQRISRSLYKQGSSHSYRQHYCGSLHKQRRGNEVGPLCALLWRILTWCTRNQVTLKARHISGHLNVIADKLSRLGQTIQTEWSLNPEIFQAICSRWHRPQVDLFATRFNNKLPQFVSPVPDPQAWAVDAISLSWEGLDPYAFPPAAILGKVVEKLQDYPCNRIILIAPGWPNVPWFWDRVAMSSQIPLCLPNIPNLVSQPFNQVLHKNLSNLNLHAWLLEPQQSWSRASLRQWQHELRLLKEDQPDMSMRQSGPFLQSGASVIRWTSGHHL